MRKIIIKPALFISVIIMGMFGLTVNVSAATVDDVIAHARAGGMSEELIQNNISMYSGENWTSEQCDRAIAELERMGYTKPAKSDSAESSETKVKTKFPVNVNEFNVLDPEKQAEVISGMLDIGKDFGFDFSIEDISDDSITVSTRDKNNKLIGVTVLGNSIEKTGIAYTIPVFTSVILIILSAAGMIITVRKSGDRI